MTFRSALTMGLVILSGALIETAAHAETPAAHAEPAGAEPSLKTVGWYLVAGGGVSLVGSATMFALQASQSAELDREAGEGTHDASARHRLEVYHSLGWAFLAVGAVGVGTGLTLVLLAPDEHKNTTRVTVGLDHVVVAGTF